MDFLIPLAINFGNSTDVIVLTPHNVEPLNKVIIDLNISRYDYYKINESTLVLTNVHYNFENDNEDLLTIFFESFYTIEKMKTLQIMIDGALIELQKDVKDILTAPDISLLLVDKVQ
uniref:Uncharacterized protein n=1 Tax=Romanomermis culicivorax TaxID=13658 RepID=A0A915LCI8_ROMCU